MQRIANTIRNRKIIAAYAAVLGLAAGLLVVAIYPPRYESTVSVKVGYHIPKPKIFPLIGQSSRVTREAAKIARVAYHYGDHLQSRMDANQVMTITARQATPGEARAEASGAARAFLQFLAQLIRDQHGQATSYVLDPAGPATPVRTFGAFAVTGLLGLAAGLLFALLIMLFPPISRGRTKTEPATAT